MHITMPEGEQFGFLAQDLEKILPQSVKQSHQPGMTDENGKVIKPGFDFRIFHVTRERCEVYTSFSAKPNLRLCGNE